MALGALYIIQTTQLHRSTHTGPHTHTHTPVDFHAIDPRTWSHPAKATDLRCVAPHRTAVNRFYVSLCQQKGILGRVKETLGY